jgi:hypothetical protein
LLKFIIKELCRTRKYSLLIPKKPEIEENTIYDLNEMNDEFSIFEFIKF